MATRGRCRRSAWARPISRSCMTPSETRCSRPPSSASATSTRPPCTGRSRRWATLSRGGAAARAGGMPRGGVRHDQALVHAVPAAPRAPVAPAKPPEPAAGVRGPVPDPLAGQPEARAKGVPCQAGGRRAVRLRGRVAGDGGVPPPRARQGHWRQQLHHHAPRQDHGDCHCPACCQSGGDEPGLAAEEAEGVLCGEGHPRHGVLAVGWAELVRRGQRRDGF